VSSKICTHRGKSGVFVRLTGETGSIAEGNIRLIAADPGAKTLRYDKKCNVHVRKVRTAWSALIVSTVSAGGVMT
jgi:hypothetical protein